MQHEGTVGEPGEREHAVGREPLAVQPLVDCVGAPLADELQEVDVVLAAAFRARPVTGGERRRLVEEEELGDSGPAVACRRGAGP